MTDLVHYQNRLSKNVRRLMPWAKRAQVGAYRLYDRDIPEFPVVVDRYDAESGTRIHLQEVDTGWQQTEREHADWMAFIVGATSEVLDLPPRSVIPKIRVRQRVKGQKDDQYLKTGTTGQELVVVERGHRFIVNLEAYLDTGLFLDHRNARALVGSRAGGKRFLNLFSYTGSFTVYAAMGGAVTSDTVDLSNTYTDWAARNLALNGIDLAAHRLVRADVLAWLREAVFKRLRYDLIVLDPPTFSNSKWMMGVLDVQRDHPWLIRQCLLLLEPEGVLFFSTNLRSFTLDASIAREAICEEVSDKTVPEDFRDRKIHRAWLIRHAVLGK